jgi:integrase
MWREMDFEQKEITIRRNWSGHYLDGEPVFWTPKSKHSIREVRIPDELCLALKKWKLQCPPRKWNLMFPKGDGQPQHRKATWVEFDMAIKAANEKAKEKKEKLRRLTVHSLHHSFASISPEGTPIPEVRSTLGHGNVNITLTVYSLYSEDADGLIVETGSSDF